MHELSIMESTLEIAINYAKREKAKSIKQISLKIGELSGVIPSALEFAFDVITKNTIAENAILKIENIPVCCYCQSCEDKFYPPIQYIFECPFCHQLSHHILQGKEIQLSSLEIEN
ncbi:hydrogenase maturation nickel metallochaperone HypA [Cyanobacterium aponinum UTEX 3222]|uniref:Hydrogenase maturation factor HypA n=3 Tax=Cyanobacterium aponinum TaxID=379064 RepID=K9Z9E9_CYAAP|nr:hydrogenase maturation nickel metallochaperone HypA [Cyanobacterium aponinum]WRL42627.1 hydrogenase maturation nickel metallochaperone HypA [Cyanobacterium aponinum UTEX 3222]AFZ55352.1 hydrogenase nickel incorporation protein hypA [Cyanobacterium aponinum PCC 10605]MBD2395803.1 hydrogenase maturation nickel metallochaperone HypA [Cyanobacterium aponinum FACHB-4101]MTF40277.1 hydrogenase maturation nickel metallochaperone HypA [Cyanobacterium aponinum 0216]PHV62862.1 hydrogenase maturation 